jgi:hypothetical protein
VLARDARDQGLIPPHARVVLELGVVERHAARGVDAQRRTRAPKLADAQVAEAVVVACEARGQRGSARRAGN